MRRWLTVFVVLAAYAWIATGAAPFSLVAYIYVGVPALSVLLSYLKSPRVRNHSYRVSPNAGAQSLTQFAPWLSVIGVALVVEAVALVLGGRSAVVPTLSTSVDHLLATHLERWVLYVLWLLAGFSPWWRRRPVGVDREL
ncbi:MAG: hypothetical protein ACYCPT_01430 [Acidimicrobiales bacterium]